MDVAGRNKKLAKSLKYHIQGVIIPPTTAKVLTDQNPLTPFCFRVIEYE